MVDGSGRTGEVVVMISGSEAAKVVRTTAQGLTQGTRAERGTTGDTVPGAGTDAITLSAKQSVARWVALARALPDVRTDRVAHLEAQVSSGQYHPDAQSIAQQMLARMVSDRLGGSL